MPLPVVLQVDANLYRYAPSDTLTMTKGDMHFRHGNLKHCQCKKPLAGLVQCMPGDVDHGGDFVPLAGASGASSSLADIQVNPFDELTGVLATLPVFGRHSTQRERQGQLEVERSASFSKV